MNGVFAFPLSVTLNSWYDEPVIGGHITFVSPSTGPGATPIKTVAVIDRNPNPSHSVPDAKIYANGVATITVHANNLPGTFVVSANARGSLQGGTTYQWSAGDLPAGNGGIVTITGVIRPDISGVSEITNTAIVAGSESGSNASMATTAMWYQDGCAPLRGSAVGAVL